MKEQSWWSNNILPLSIVFLVFCGLVAGTAGILHWVSICNRSSNDFINKQKVPHTSSSYARPKSANSAAWGVYGSYMESIEKEIKSNWHPPKRNLTRRVTVIFKVDRQGNLSKLKVTPSGDEELDLSARKAVEETAPFAPLPKEATDKSVDIQFTFDYNVYERNRKANH